MSLKKSFELKAIPFLSLDLTPGHGNLLGESYWEMISPWRGDALTLNTGVSPREEKGSSLSRILQAEPPTKYYLSQKACLGILRRASERGKELPEKLKRALEIQAGLVSPDGKPTELKAFHINQRDEGIDLNGVSGALMVSGYGVPTRTKQCGSCGERSHSAMNELSPLGGSEGYGACGDAQMQTFVTQPDEDTVEGFDGYNGDLTGDVVATLGVNCGMSIGRNGIMTFTQNQRDEVRDLHDVAGALCTSPGTKQQTFVAGVTAKGNGDCFISKERHTSLSNGGGQAGQGYPCILCLNDQSGERMDVSVDKTATLRAQMNTHQPLVMDTPTEQPNEIYENHGIDSRYTGPHKVVPTMSARMGTGGNNIPLVEQEPVYCIVGNVIDRQPQNGGNGKGYQEDIAYTLTATDHHAVFSRQRVDELRENEVVSTQSARQHKDATDLICQPSVFGQSQFGNYQEGVSTLRAQGGDNGGGSENLITAEGVPGALLIRRLTPLECERLQGFPDGWTDIPKASDAARYKALGNSVAIPCVEYVLAGIVAALRQAKILNGKE